MVVVMNAHVILRGRDLKTLDTTYAASPGNSGQIFVELTEEGVRTIATDNRRLASAFVSREVSEPVHRRVLAVPGYHAATKAFGSVSELNVVVGEGGVVVFEANGKYIVESAQELERTRLLKRTDPYTQVLVNKRSFVELLQSEEGQLITMELESSGIYLGEEGFLEGDFDGFERSLVLDRNLLEQAVKGLPGRNIVIDIPKDNQPITVSDARSEYNYAVLKQVRQKR